MPSEGGGGRGSRRGLAVGEKRPGLEAGVLCWVLEAVGNSIVEVQP